MSNARPPSRTDDCTHWILQPMIDEEGRPIIDFEHLVDAAVVGAIMFFALLLGDAVPAILFGNGAYITVRDILTRLPTAAIAFCLTLSVQWARYRGVELRPILTGKE